MGGAILHKKCRNCVFDSWDSSFSDNSNSNVFMQLDSRFTQKLFKGVSIDLVLIA